MDPTSRGRKYYQEKNYEKALQAFDRAVIVSSDNLLLTALDHRAATYEKLGKLGAALKDAKEMIELKPSLAKGYLRCAKVLLIKGENGLAKKIYERGLEKVKVGSDNDRQLLQGMYKKLCQKDEPAPCFDPLDRLPPELARLICDHLELSALVVCLVVSKSWKRFLESYPELWTTVDLRGSRKYMNKTSLMTYLRRSRYELLHAYLPVKATDSASLDRIIYITSHCRKLETLSLYSGPVGESLLKAILETKNLKTLVLESGSISLNHVLQILKLCPKLQIAKFDEVTNSAGGASLPWPHMEELTEFKLRANETYQGRHIHREFPNLAQHFPNLKSLTLQRVFVLAPNFFSWKGLESLDLSESEWVWQPLIQPALKRLTLSNMAIRLQDLSDFVARCDIAALEYLNCSGSKNFQLRDIFHLVQPSLRLGNLRELHLDKCAAGDLDGASIEAIPTSSSIEIISLSEIQVSEDILLKILEKFPNLRRVNLSRTTATGVLIKALEEREHGPLEWVSLRGCPNLSSDAVEYARTKGTVVELSIWNPKKTWREGMASSRIVYD